SDRWLSRYDTIIVDEAHERSLNIDFLLGYLKRLLPRRPDLKLVVTSATIDTERFAGHFGGAPVVEVEGRGYPVEVRYRPLGEGEADEAPPPSGGGRARSRAEAPGAGAAALRWRARRRPGGGAGPGRARRRRGRLRRDHGRARHRRRTGVPARRARDPRRAPGAGEAPLPPYRGGAAVRAAVGEGPGP